MPLGSRQLHRPAGDVIEVHPLGGPVLSNSGEILEPPHRIRTLERELDSRLFERTTHHVGLTDAGAALLPEARRTLAAAAAALEAVDQVRGGLRGTVTLGTMQAQAMGAVTLAELIAAFREQHPGVEVRLRQAGSLEMAAAVRDGPLDLAFVGIGRRAPALLASMCK